MNKRNNAETEVFYADGHRRVLDIVSLLFINPVPDSLVEDIQAVAGNGHSSQ